MIKKIYFFGLLMVPFGLLMAKNGNWRTDSAWALLEKGNNDAVIRWVNQSLIELGPSIQPVVLTDLLTVKGNALRRSGQIRQALKQHQEVLALRKKIFPTPSLPISRSWVNIGNCLLQLGAYVESEEAFRSAIQVAPQNADKLHLANIYNSLGSVFNEKGELDKAYYHYNKAFQTQSLDLSPHDYRHQNTLVNLADNCLNRYDYPAAGVAIRLLERLKRAPTAPFFAKRLKATHYRQLGEFQKAISLLRETIAEWEKFEPRDENEWQICLIELSRALQESGEIDAAIDLLKHALGRLDQVSEWQPIKFVLHNNIATLFQLTDQDDLAIIHYENALELLQATQTKENNSIYLNLASLYLKNKELSICSAYLNQIKHNHPDPKTMTTLWLLSGQLSTQTKQYHHALKDYQKAYTLIFPQKKQYPELFAFSTLMIAQSLRMTNQVPLALNFLQQGFVVLGHDKGLKQDLHPVETIQLLAERAKLMLALAKIDSSAVHWDNAFRVHQRAIRFLKKHQIHLEGQFSVLFSALEFRSVFEGMVETCFAKGKNEPEYLDKAFTYAEMSKAFLLQRLTQESRAKTYANVPEQYIKQEIGLQNAISNYEAQLAACSNDYLKRKLEAQLAELIEKKRQLLRQLETEYPAYHRLKYTSKSIDTKQIAANLGKDKSLISYFITADDLYIFALTKDGLHAKKQALSMNWNKTINTWYGLVNQPKVEIESLAEMAKLGKQLYDVLLRPVEQKLRSRLLIIPDGRLNYLPFDALLCEETDPEIPIRKFPYLIKRYTLSYASSAVLLPGASNSRKNSGYLLAMSPVFNTPTSNLSALPNAKREIQLVAKQMTLRKKIFQDTAANETQFKVFAPKARIIHLATHGVVNVQNPNLSYLAFSNYSPQSFSEGRLTVAEIYGLRLNAELVFLSACETGLGELYTGEGMFSLSRAFFYAGAKSWVATLWSIPDNQTTKIVEAFYDNLYQGKAKDVALQLAKLDYLEKSRDFQSHPAYWAAFAVSGDLSPLKQPVIGQFWGICGMALVALLTLFYFFRKK